MRKIYILCLLTLVASAHFAQVRQTFKYQTVARNSTGQILENQTVSFRISIIQGELPGNVVYSETQMAITNENGLVSFIIGQGEAPKGDISAIIPDEATYFIQLEIDTNGGVNYSLMEICRLSGNSQEFISPQSINISSGNNPGSNYPIPGENAESLIANINIIDEGTNHDNSAVFTLNQHVVGVPQGWSGLSSYVIPDNPDIESIFLPVQDQLIMLFSDQGVYYPSQQINTLVNWDPQSGYVAKFNQETNLAFSGQLIQNATISLTGGWNLIPVLASCPVNVDSLFENYDVTIVKEVADWKLFWPEMGIHTLNELMPGNAYYVLMSSPAEINFPQCIIPEWHCGDILVDTRDGRTYETVLIGEQCWMAQNLNFGSLIDGTSEQTDNDIIEKYCYNNNVANCNEYGGLYQWDEMMQYSVTPGVSGICPAGWYLPDDAEWNELTDYLGGLAVAGGKMKEMGTSHWSSPNTGATNSSEFTGLPGGFRGNDGSFNNIGFYGNFWTASKTDATSSKRRYMTWNSTQVTQNSLNKFSGLSVRCRRDDPETSVLMVNPESLTVSFDQGEITFDVTSNTAWTVESNQPWMTITPASGINDQILTVNYEANEGSDSRVGEIILTAISGFPVVTVTLTQAGLAWTCGQPFVDERDGNTYNTVQVGTQCWMAQNLKVGNSVDIASDQIDNGVIERYCYDNNIANCNIYGGLYQWDEMMQYSIGIGVKGICPESWHVPGLSEWDQLCNFLGGYAMAGGKMKETGTIEEGTGLWHTPNTGATNSSGMTVLPSGYRLPDSVCYDLGYFTILWSSGLNTYLPVTFALFSEGQDVMTFEPELNYGNAVRCIKDADSHAFTTISPSRQYVTFPSGGATFSVNANTTWTVSEAVTWLSVEPTGGSNNGTITVNYDENSTPITRTGIIEVFDGINLIELMIIQDRFIPELSVTPANQDVSPAGGTVNFEVTSNTTWNVTESVSWLSVSPASGSNNGTLAVSCEANGTNDTRTGTITITAAVGTPVVTVTVTQVASVLTVNPDNKYVSSLAGTTTFIISSNTHWSLEENVSWLSVIPISGSYDDTLTVTFNDNTSADLRIGQITITAAGGNPFVSIIVNQVGVFSCGQLITDIRDGNTYTTIQLGEQCWMAQNLNIGTRINGNIQQTNNGTVQKHCYNDIETNCNIYGGLYQWNEMMNYTTASTSGICPEGWHLPTDGEWALLTDYLKSQPEYLCNSDTNWIAKSLASATDWNASTFTCAVGNDLSTNNASGFTGLPGGGYLGDYFGEMGSRGYWWSSTEYSLTHAWYWFLHNNSSEVYRSRQNIKTFSRSARCVWGNLPPEIPSNPIPENSSINQNLNLLLSWSCADINGGLLTYDVLFGTQNPPAQVATAITDTFYQPGSFNYNTTYYWQIVAHDDHGETTEGEVWSFTTLEEYLECGDLILDERDGKLYNTLQIGAQCWMKENLNVGVRIDGIQNQTNNETIEKYCINNLETNCEVYGGLYQWNEMMGYSLIAGLQGICPDGWHLPTDAEWTALTTYLGGVSIAGGKMKETGTNHWYSPNSGATNSSGFTALPGGGRSTNGSFYDVGYFGDWWSSSQDQYDASYAYCRSLHHYNAQVDRVSSFKSYGHSVRCISDTPPSHLEVTPLNQNVSFTAGVTTFDITSNTTWSVTENNDWLSVSPMSGSNNGSLTVSYDANTSTDVRIGQIVITATGGTPIVTVTVNQAGAIIWNCGEAITDDRDGKTYTTVQIGDQCWMAQNLNVGNRIDGINEQTNNGTIEKYCYDNLESNCDVYGGLYQWDEMMQFSTTPGVQGICPTGWHVPTNTEYSALTEYLGGENVAGGKLKESGTIHWNSPNTGATNSSGFTALPGGSRYTDGTFHFLGIYGNWWSSTQYNASNIWYRYLAYNYASGMGPYYYGKLEGFSVRCIKDDNTSSQLEVTPTNQDVSASAGVTNFAITSNTSWTVTENNDWLSVTPMSGSANGTLTVSYDANTSTDPRTGQIVITATGGTPIVTVTVNQAGAIIWNCGEAFTDDRDGKTYTTVQIGNQCWMAQNLNIGTKINGSSNQTNNGTIEKYCFNNSESNCTTFGGLYQWNETMQYSTMPGVQGICPTGWHVPTDAEFTVLTTYVSSQPEYLCDSNTDYIAKALAATTYWSTTTGTCKVGDNLSANNATGFNGLPGGYRSNDGYFYELSYRTGWLSSTQPNTSNSWERQLHYNYPDVGRYYCFNPVGLSVRCIKDETITSQLEVTPSNQDVPATAGDTNFSITSNISWSVTENNDWLSVSPMSGSNNGSLTVTYDENNLPDVRTGNIIITASGGDPSVTVTLTQDGFSTIFAGLDTLVCEGEPFLLDQAEAQNYVSVEWTTPGDGFFDDVTLINPTYFPGTNDWLNQSVELCLTAFTGNPATPELTDCMILTFQPLPVVYAGDPAIIYENELFQTNASALHYSALLWETTGDGFFEDASSLNTIYHPGSQDIVIGEVMLSLTANPNQPCIDIATSVTTLTIISNNWSCGQPITDERDGKTYSTIQIGNQCWMAQNLNVGTRINGSSNQTNNSTIEKYCYNNTESNCTTYGGLYQWNEMMQYITTPGIQGICPQGWHVPTDGEWTALTNYVSSQPAWVCGGNNSYVAKALAAKTNWISSSNTCAVGNNLNTNNATSFTALPGGYRGTDGSFYNVSNFGGWWSSFQYDASNAWYRNLFYFYAEVYRDYYNKSGGLSVRCLKD